MARASGARRSSHLRNPRAQRRLSPTVRALPDSLRPDSLRLTRRPPLALLLAVLLPAALGACQAERALRITSEPSQAEVRLDGTKVGITPCEVPFEHYGVRRLTLYLPGYATYSRVLEVEPPWYGQFPVDIFTEVLVPIGWSDIQKVHVRLVKGQSVLLEPDLPSVIERADALRHAGPAGPQKRTASDEEREQP